MFGAARVRKYSLSQCSMFTPTAAWQGAIKKVVDENKAASKAKEEKVLAEGERLAHEIDRLSSTGGGEEPSAAMLDLISRERTTVDLAKYDKASWVPKQLKSVTSGIANKAGFAAKMAKTGAKAGAKMAVTGATKAKNGVVGGVKYVGGKIVARND